MLLKSHPPLISQFLQLIAVVSNPPYSWLFPDFCLCFSAGSCHTFWSQSHSVFWSPLPRSPMHGGCCFLWNPERKYWSWHCPLTAQLCLAGWCMLPKPEQSHLQNHKMQQVIMVYISRIENIVLTILIYWLYWLYWIKLLFYGSFGYFFLTFPEISQFHLPK